MSNRQEFSSNNTVGKVLTFQKSGATSSFDPAISFTGVGARRVSWRFNNGSEIKQIAGNNIVYTGFTSDTAIRNIEMRGNSFKNISSFTLNNDNLYGNLDLTSLIDLRGTFNISTNPNLTGVTHGSSSQNFTQYTIQNCGLVGNLNLTPLSGLGGVLTITNNPELTSVTFPSTTNTFSIFSMSACDLTGNLDLTPLSGLSGNFNVQNNSNLTGITHTPTTNIFSSYAASNCNLQNNLYLPFSGLGGTFNVQNNTGLTSITHVESIENFTNYSVDRCGITGNLIIPLKLGGTVQYHQNSNLTGVTHYPSSNQILIYNGGECNLTGNLDLTPLSGLGGSFNLRLNSNLTGVTHSPSSNYFTLYDVSSCGLLGTHDLSMFSNFGGTSGSAASLRVYLNGGLNDIIFPLTNGYFRNSVNNDSNAAFGLYSCNLGYIDFKPLSGATLLSGVTQGLPRISLQNNGMSAGDVNHILVDFSGNATYNPTGWSNVNLNIGGTNASPDSSSGGYDGLSAVSFLTGSPNNWLISY